MEKFYSCEEIAERYSVNVVTVWRWIRKHDLPAVKIGNTYRITAEDLAAFEAKHRTVQADVPC